MPTASSPSIVRATRTPENLLDTIAQSWSVDACSARHITVNSGDDGIPNKLRSTVGMQAHDGSEATGQGTMRNGVQARYCCCLSSAPPMRVVELAGSTPVVHDLHGQNNVARSQAFPVNSEH